jgi:hypothetical protein
MTDEKHTQPLHVTDDTQVLPAPGDTRRLPAGEASAAPEPDPFAGYDQPRPVRDEPFERVDAPGSVGGARPLVRTGPRTGTIVWGFLVLAAGVGLLAQAAGASIDLELAVIVLMGAAGALLVIGSLVSAARRRRAEARA